MIQLILPMAGESRRFFEAGYSQPKPFFKLGRSAMLDRVLDQFPTDWERVFVMNEKMRVYEDLAASYLPSRAHLTWIEANREGPLQSVQKALEICNLSQPTFVSYCDYRSVWNPKEFESFVQKLDCDIAIVTYRGFHPHYCTPNTYCYVRTAEDDHLGDRHPKLITGIREKSSFTANREAEHASTGGYYFRSGGLLKRGLELQKQLRLHWSGEYFTSFAIQALMAEGARAYAFEVPYFFQWGTPEDVRAFEFWERKWKTQGNCRYRPSDVETLEQVAPFYSQKLEHQATYFENAFALLSNLTPKNKEGST